MREDTAFCTRHGVLSDATGKIRSYDAFIPRSLRARLFKVSRNVIGSHFDGKSVFRGFERVPSEHARDTTETSP